MDAQSFFIVTNHVSPQKHIIETHLTDYENTILSKEAAIKLFGLVAKDPQTGKFPAITHHKTGKRYLARLPKDCNSLLGIPSETIRFSWRRLKDGRTFVVISRWPL